MGTHPPGGRGRQHEPQRGAVSSGLSGETSEERACPGRKPRTGQGAGERGGGRWAAGRGRKTTGGGGSGAEASRSEGFLVPRGHCFGAVPADSRCLRVSQCKHHTQVCPAETSLPYRLASWLLRSQHPGPVSAGLGPGVRSGARRRCPLPGAAQLQTQQAQAPAGAGPGTQTPGIRALAKALLLFLRKMQQESSLLL